MTQKQALGISRAKAYELANRADFPAIRFGRKVVVPVAAFYKWLEEITEEGGVQI